MGLQVIRHAGIQVYCSDLITDVDNNIYLLGVAGYQTAIKGIAANILEGESVYIHKDGELVYFQKAEQRFTIHYLKLPSGLYQCMILSVIGLPGTESDKSFLIIGDDIGFIKKLFFRHLDEKTEIPLHYQWTDWLWETFIEKGWLNNLISVAGTLKGFLVDMMEAELREVITEAIAYQVPQIMQCFEKGEIDVSKS